MTKTKLKKLDYNNFKHVSIFTENKFLNPIWMLGQNTPD